MRMTYEAGLYETLTKMIKLNDPASMYLSQSDFDEMLEEARSRKQVLKSDDYWFTVCNHDCVFRLDTDEEDYQVY